MPSANPVVQTVISTTGVTLSLSLREAVLLRTMLGGLKLKTRRGAVVKNGGSQADAEEAASLTREIFTALDSAGAKKLGPPTAQAASYETDSGPDDYPSEDDDLNY